MKVSICKNKVFVLNEDRSHLESCIGYFNMTEEDYNKVILGCDIEKTNNDPGYIITETEEYTTNSQALINSNKLETVKDSTLDDLLSSEDDFSSLELSGKEIGEILSDKFFGGNIYKELQLHRIMLQKLLKVVIKGETLTEDDISIIQSLEDMDNKAELILGKFKK